jgi:hypothetical protein
MGPVVLSLFTDWVAVEVTDSSSDTRTSTSNSLVHFESHAIRVYVSRTIARAAALIARPFIELILIGASHLSSENPDQAIAIVWLHPQLSSLPIDTGQVSESRERCYHEERPRLMPF